MFLASSADAESAGSYEFCIHSLACLRERAGLRGPHSFPRWGKAGMEAFGFLFGRCACGEEGSRVSARQPTPFLLRRQKKWGKEKASLAGGLSGETHFAPSSLRSNSRRKFEFLYGSTPVLPLACGVAQALRLELPLPLAGEGGGEGTCISFPRWGKAGMGANLVGKWPQRRCATAVGFLNEICLWRLCSKRW